MNTPHLKVGNVVIYGVTSEDELTREVLGGKGYSLVEMAKKGINVPESAILPCAYGALYLTHPDVALEHASQFIALAEDHINSLKPTDPKPLVSVRSGARVSMAGMMDTILNVGVSLENLDEYKNFLGEACAIDCMNRLTKMMLSTVLGAKEEHIYDDLDANLAAFEVYYLKGLPERKEQIMLSVRAVFESWNNERAKYYRKMNNIPDDWGTAVIIQRMVFGNLNNNSCTGVLFTRNPDNGDLELVGEYLPNAQGEDVVSGAVTPIDISVLAKEKPKLYKKLVTTVMKLEKSWGDVLDVEFTIENGVLYLLQCRSAKKSAVGAVRLSLGMFLQGLLPIENCLKMVEPKHLDLVVQDKVILESSPDFYVKGIPACSGVVSGVVCQSLNALKAAKAKGYNTIFVAEETTPDDIEAMHLSNGVITYKGGATSHAAVVARSMNKPCIVGVKSLSNSVLQEGLEYTFCGSLGYIWNEYPVIQNGNTSLLDEWVDVFSTSLNVKIVEALHPTRLADLYDSEMSVYDSSRLPQYAMAESMFGEMAIPDGVTEIYGGRVHEAAQVQTFDNIHDFLNHEGKAQYTGKITPTQKTLYQSVLKLREKLWGEVIGQDTDIILSKSQFLGVLLHNI